MLVALHADRLSHRRRQGVTTMYFEHVLQLPQSFHGGTHSGRLMKVMLTGVEVPAGRHRVTLEVAAWPGTAAGALALLVAAALLAVGWRGAR